MLFGVMLRYQFKQMLRKLFQRICDMIALRGERVIDTNKILSSDLVHVQPVLDLCLHLSKYLHFY